ncbi:hypothetical protein DB44_ER00310 [Candidatus Protochlamydia amoebophila]|uniref:Uncharacterized protein n=2 Tax=Candidatus Protochlamydia amoebophila TaxID=362787 RepID=A0A0C1JV42_9BACT|nr:hypothetical protein DB44_ER00310 [Candidatus Protochlamydia amoebophila]
MSLIKDAILKFSEESNKKVKAQLAAYLTEKECNMPSSDEINPVRFNPRSESSSLGRSRPEGTPRSDKNFKKLVRNDEEPSKEQEELAALEEENEAAPLSLFDLSAKNKSTRKSPSMVAKNPFIKEESNQQPILEMAENGNPQLEQISTEKPLKDTFLHGEIVRESVIEGKKEKNSPFTLATDSAASSPKKEKQKLSRTPFEVREEQVDLSAINSQQRPIAFLADKAELAEEPKTLSSIKDIVAQIVEKMQIIKTGEKTDTVVTLRYPPIFEGATVTLTNFEGAAREFNVAFANLTDEAKRFLDRKIVEDSLVENLARQDIIVNVLTTTTLPEANADTDSYKYFTREEREQKRDQQAQDQKEEE